MSTNCIIGYTGFVGSNIINNNCKIHFDEFYNSKNIDYANPLLYGSCKNKIHVFIFKPSDTIFRLKNLKVNQKNIKNLKLEENLNKENLNID